MNKTAMAMATTIATASTMNFGKDEKSKPEQRRIAKSQRQMRLDWGFKHKFGGYDD